MWSFISNPADLILPRAGYMGALWLGSTNAVCDDFLLSNNITCVISLAPVECAVQHHHYFAVGDSKDDTHLMSSVINTAVPLIHRYRMTGCNVLVHCKMGMQRAPTVIAHYLHRYSNRTLRESCNWILDRRPAAFYFGIYYTFKDLLIAGPSDRTFVSK